MINKRFINLLTRSEFFLWEANRARTPGEARIWEEPAEASVTDEQEAGGACRSESRSNRMSRFTQQS